MSRPTARPKRAAEDFARTHQNEDEEGHTSKKPRFDVRNPSALAPDALETDAVLEADEIGKRGQQVRRNAVNIDGYDSDSENEGFKGRAAAKARAQDKSKDEEENDMFADLDDDFKDGDDEEGDAAGSGAKSKTVRFLEEDEIEGQVQSSTGGGHVSADFTLHGGPNGEARQEEQGSNSESEVDEETRAEVGEEVDEELGAGAKKVHAPKLDAFNMRNEQEEGRFDEQGNFVRKAADPDAVHDTWLEGISKKDMKKAQEAAEKREQERRQKDVANDARLTTDLLSILITLLEPSETSLEALARLGKGIERRPKWQTKHKNRKKGQHELEDTEMHEEDLAEAKRKAAVESLTEAADLLLGRGQPEIYDIEREMLIRQYRKEAGEDWQDPPATGNGQEVHADPAVKMWEYRWLGAGDAGEVHGPYDGMTMVQWNEAGYFSDGVQFRRAGDTSSEWSRVVGFT